MVYGLKTGYDVKFLPIPSLMPHGNQGVEHHRFCGVVAFGDAGIHGTHQEWVRVAVSALRGIHLTGARAICGCDENAAHIFLR